MLSAKVRQTTFLQVLTYGVFSSCFLVVFPDPDGSEFLVLVSDPDPGDNTPVPRKGNETSSKTFNLNFLLFC